MEDPSGSPLQGRLGTLNPRGSLPACGGDSSRFEPVQKTLDTRGARSYPEVERVQIERVALEEEAMNVNYTVVTYLIYLAISIGLTIWVARTLHRNGRIFLVDVFHGNEPLADSVNHLLVVGFYLISFGYVSLP